MLHLRPEVRAAYLFALLPLIATAQEPRHAMARYNLFNLSFSRALALRDLGRQEDAARDWKRAIEVSEGQTGPVFKVGLELAKKGGVGSQQSAPCL